MAEMYSLDEEVKQYWSIAGVRRALFYTFIAGMSEFLFLDDFVESWPLPYMVFTGLVFLLFMILAFLLPSIQYRHWRFGLGEGELILRRGIFTKVDTTAPYNRIQHLDVKESFFERKFGIATLIIYTAGSRGADLVIPGLPKDYAFELRDSLNEYVKEDEV
ncbi:MAG: PH domain-containing protein [Candidatus Kapaibacteriales bacterium]